MKFGTYGIHHNRNHNQSPVENEHNEKNKWIGWSENNNG